ALCLAVQASPNGKMRSKRAMRSVPPAVPFAGFPSDAFVHGRARNEMEQPCTGPSARHLSARPARFSFLQKRLETFLLIRADEALRSRFVFKYHRRLDINVTAAGE